MEKDTVLNCFHGTYFQVFFQVFSLHSMGDLPPAIRELANLPIKFETVFNWCGFAHHTTYETESFRKRSLFFSVFKTNRFQYRLVAIMKVVTMKLLQNAVYWHISMSDDNFQQFRLLESAHTCETYSEKVHESKSSFQCDDFCLVFKRLMTSIKENVPGLKPTDTWQHKTLFHNFSRDRNNCWNKGLPWFGLSGWALLCKFTSSHVVKVLLLQGENSTEPGSKMHNDQKI